MSAVHCLDGASSRRLSDGLHIVDEELWYWAKHKRSDRAPNDWYTEWNVERSVRGPRSTAPVVLPERFVKIDRCVAQCTNIEQKVLTIRFVRYPNNGKDFQRRRLNMSEGKWDRLLKKARETVALALTF